MSTKLSCVMTLMLAALVGCGGADTDPPAAEPAQSEPAPQAAPVDAAPARVAATPPIIDHAANGEPQLVAPAVEPAYQNRVENAWQRALAGSDPTNSCAVLKSQLTVRGAAPGPRALAACNVDVPVRYFHTLLERAQSGQTTCAQVSSVMLSQLPALTMSQARVREMLGSDTGSSSNSGVDEAASDSARMVKDRLYDAVVATCPAEAAEMMQ